MASDWGIEEKGFDTLELQLKQMSDMTPLVEAMKDALTVVKQEASRFPPQPSRTRSKHFNTWVREVGQLPRSAFGISSKTGKLTIRRRGVGVLRASEKLLAHWKEAQPQVTVTPTSIEGRVTNPVSYGPFVQGEQQASFHAQTGWLTTQAILSKQQARIVAVFEKALQRKLQQGA